MKKSQKYSWYRTLNQGGVVTLFGNPVSQVYIMRVAPLIQIQSFMGSSKAIIVTENIIKSLVHFLIGGPIQISIFLGGTQFFKTFSVEDAKENIRTRFWPIYTTGMYFWPFFNMFCYSFVSRQLHQPINDFFAFFWAIILSYLNNRKKQPVTSSSCLPVKSSLEEVKVGVKDGNL